jgi:hypothetical protein
MVVPVFVLDANVFIQAHRHYYAFDLAPRFWEGLVQCAAKGHLESIDRVKQELERGKDELATWAGVTFSGAFVSTDDDGVLASYSDIMTWAMGQSQFSDAAKSDFAKGADGWLVAYAKVHGRVIVTHEALSLDIKKKIPIPNVCQAFNVRYVNTFEMMRELGMKWA